MEQNEVHVSSCLTANVCPRALVSPLEENCDTAITSEHGGRGPGGPRNTGRVDPNQRRDLTFSHFAHEQIPPSL